jgi:Ser/Thr protein kinase RdoA (MazF antagonist)
VLRNPTWHGLRPGLPRLDPAPAWLADAVSRVTGHPGTVSLARFDAADVRYARLDRRDGRGALFLKILPRSRQAHQERAEDLARWLEASGQPVNACLEGYPRPFDADHLLFAYPWRDGRRLRSEESDLATLGTRLASLHAALARYPARAALAAATESRFAELHRVRAELASGRSVGAKGSRLQSLAREPSLDFEPSGRHDATPLHDDLNPGNLLMSPEGEPIFMDFEDALHGVLPVVFDLGLVIERLVLAAEPDDARAVDLGRAFLSAYRSGGGEIRVVEPGELALCLRARALRALCTLSLCQWRGIEVVEQEWEKFFFFEELARRRAAALGRLWQAAP